jgi:predicted HAD superfamily Cof-like phosphohydrolase
MKSNHQLRIEAMMNAAGQELPATPVIPNEDVRRLRAMLILEEALETCEALGFRLGCNGSVPTEPLKDAIKRGDFFYEAVEPDLVEIADGCADISVVTIGTLSACGIADNPILEAVDQNNLEKFGEGGYRNEHGKWIKPPGHKPPDIQALLEDQGYAPADET